MSVLEGATNYYEVLQIPRDATHETIVRQFRALSMRCNPVRNPTNMQVNQLKFDEMCEAFEVLSNSELKAIYDKYGEYGLKEGIIGSDGKKYGGGFFMKRQAQEIYEAEFTATDPWGYQDRFTEQMQYGSLFNNSTRGAAYKAAVGPQDIVLVFECTLAEFYNGSLKYQTFTRNILKDNARTTEPETVDQQIEVKRGFSEKTVLRFKGQGHQMAGYDASDLVIKFTQTCDATFKRIGNDLVLKKKISLVDAIKGTPVSVKTLDGRQLTLVVDELISPQTCRQVPNEGMPDGCGGMGFLYIKFDIIFPTDFTTEGLQKIVGALKANAEELA